MTTSDQKAYYRQLTAIDIGEVARELLGERLTETRGSTWHADCPAHHSVSGTSLHIELDKQLWRCWGCGVSGDVLQLVEFIQHGVVTSGMAGRMSETHRVARDWLAAKVGLPKLTHVGLSEDDILELERGEVTLQRAQAVLTAATEWYHQRLLATPAVVEWLAQQYAFSPEVLAQYRIGYADPSGLRAHLYEAGFSPDELLASGLFRPNEAGDERQVTPVFVHRVMVPYFSRGRVSYLIGRKTPWTPNERWEAGKYKKLPVYDPEKRPWIAPGIENARLFNEDILLRRPAQVIITEGIMDAIALASRGFACVSPVTTRIRHDDWARLLPALQGVREVIICQDNEISGAGWQGALQTAAQLEAAGIACRLAELPLEPQQEAARTTLRERFGISAAESDREREAALTDCTAEARAEAQALLAQAKIDVCDYFVAGHTVRDFQQLVTRARLPIEVAIDQCPDELSVTEKRDLVSRLIRAIGQQPTIEHERLLKALQSKLGPDYKLSALRTVLRETQKTGESVRKPEDRHPAEQASTTSVCMNGRYRYSLVDNGIVRELVKMTPEGPVIMPPEGISNFHLRVRDEQLLDDGELHHDGTTIASSRMHGDIIGDGWQKPFEIPSTAWGSNGELAQKITEVARHRAIFSTRHLDDIRLVSNAVSTDVREEVVRVIFGMHPTGGFVTPTLTIADGIIHRTAETGVRVDVGSDYNKARHLDLLPCPDDELRDMLTHLLTDFVAVMPDRVMLPILAHAFLGPIAFHEAVLQEFSPFTLFIAGSSGKGKTETARLAQCLWGDFTTKEKLAGWGSTPEINRQEAARCRGGLWLIDDFKRQKVGASQWANALRLLTDYADLQARKRATPGAKVISAVPIQAMLMVTGEDLPFNETSALARSLVVEFDGRHRMAAQYQACLARQDDYRKVMAPYIAWWQRQDRAVWLERIREVRDNFCAFMTGEGLEADNARRVAGNAALSQVGLEACWSFCYAVGIDPQAVTGRDLPTDYIGILQEILRRMILLVNEAKPGESFLNTLLQLLAAGRVKIRERYQDESDDRGVPVVGYHARSGNVIYLLPRLAMGAVRDAYKRGEDEPLYFTTAAIGKQLAEAGIILPEDIQRKELVRRVRIPGGGRAVNPEWVWRIDAEKLQALLQQYSRENGEADLLG
jgi:DNA primase